MRFCIPGSPSASGSEVATHNNCIHAGESGDEASYECGHHTSEHAAQE